MSMVGWRALIPPARRACPSGRAPPCVDLSSLRHRATAVPALPGSDPVGDSRTVTARHVRYAAVP
ncbi:hypothetical protein [Streptomyces vinaceus]|uniref:hypothetical protein n=1 Tax=Streptomyces vinaceus TaxID=1960 RepID=UPI0036C0CF6F